MKKVYFRSITWGGLWLKQLIFFGVVIGICHNSSRNNGDLGWSIIIKRRNQTAL